MKTEVRKFFIRSGGVAAAAVLCVLVFRDVDIEAVSRAVAAVGYAFIGILSVYLIGCVFDVAAWRRLMPASSRDIPFLTVLAIHIAGESFYRFIPAGVVVGDSVKFFLLRRHTHLDASQAVSGLLLRKLFMGIAQVFYIGGAVLLGIVFRNSGVPVVLEITGGLLAAALIVLFLAAGYGILKGKLCASLFSLLMRVPVPKLRAALEAHSTAFNDTDEILRDVLRTRRSDVLAAIVLFGCNWMTELFETSLIFFALGASVSVGQVMLFEPVISLVRSIAFIFPGGLGVMDAGYIAALRSFGIGNAVVTAAAFIVIKRSKELVWIVIGITVTMIMGGYSTTYFITAPHRAEASETV